MITLKTTNQNPRGTVMIRKAGKTELEILANLTVLMRDSNSVNELITEFSEIISMCSIILKNMKI